MSVAPQFFRDAAALRRWFASKSATADELIVGFMKKATGVASVTYPEALDEALCVGWIDGIRRRLDDERYSVRFTPRRARSLWSAVNTARVEVLQQQGRMKTAGLEAFAKRDQARSAAAALAETTEAEFSAAERKRFGPSWAFFAKQAPSYCRAVTRWVLSAKKSKTRERRLERLIAASAEGRRFVG